jgi:hypothetical protein
MNRYYKRAFAIVGISIAAYVIGCVIASIVIIFGIIPLTAVLIGVSSYYGNCKDAEDERLAKYLLVNYNEDETLMPYIC